jgi:hypothetical protein
MKNHEFRISNLESFILPILSIHVNSLCFIDTPRDAVAFPTRRTRRCSGNSVQGGGAEKGEVGFRLLRFTIDRLPFTIQI